MICPNCKSEYVEGYVRCADCDMDLVESLPPEPQLPPPEKSVEVYRAHGNAEAGLIKSLLEGSGIQVFVGANAMVSTHGFSVGAISEIPIWVPESDAKEAAELIKAALAGKLKSGS